VKKLKSVVEEVELDEIASSFKIRVSLAREELWASHRLRACTCYEDQHEQIY
jgi:hypothetical protein